MHRFRFECILNNDRMQIGMNATDIDWRMATIVNHTPASSVITNNARHNTEFDISSSSVCVWGGGDAVNGRAIKAYQGFGRIVNSQTLHNRNTSRAIPQINRNKKQKYYAKKHRNILDF